MKKTHRKERPSTLQVLGDAQEGAVGTSTIRGEGLKKPWGGEGISQTSCNWL